MSPSEPKVDLRSETHIQRLDDARERMIRCETQIEGLEKNKASREDIANAKLSLILSGFAVFTAIVVPIVIRLIWQ